MLATYLNNLKRGDFFTLKPYENPNEMQVYVKGAYDRSSKEYSCYKFGDINYERFFSPFRKVYIDFTF